MKYDVVKVIREITPHGRSLITPIRTLILAEDREEEIAKIVVEACATAITIAQPLTLTCRKVSMKVHTNLGLEIPNDDSTILKIGMSCLHWAALAKLVKAEKYHTITDSKVKEMWYIVSTSEEFTEYANSLSPSTFILSPINGPMLWTTPLHIVDDKRIPIVKKAERYNLLHLYTTTKMPNVYDSLNRLGMQGFKVNQRILGLTENVQSTPFGFIPIEVSEGTRKTALRSINDVSRKAKFVEEIKFKEMNKWLLDEAELNDEQKRTLISKKTASEKSQDYYDTNAEEHLSVISNWSKRLDFEKICSLAHEWDGHTINYLFNMCTRGRIYAVQNYLSPLGSDLAKAMLVFDNEYQISGYDFCIHIANCFGQDKLSFEDRVQWVNDNSNKLRAIGDDPIKYYHLIVELGLDSEQKTKWQGVAACIEYTRYCEYINTHGTEEGFLSNLIIGLDATASGTQILTILGRDDKVAPYVNVSASTDGNVGDFYTYLSSYLKPKLEEHRGLSKSLDAILNNWIKYNRKLSKRNSMTFSYSGTKYGFGTQHWEDRHDYGPLGSDLTRADCRIIGNEMYDVCLENIRGGAEIMKWLQDGINYHKNGAIISWTLPDGFTAFQVCDKSKVNHITGKIGTQLVNLNYFTFQDKADIKAHKNGIAPNFVHSYDSYLLRLIVNGMPLEAPISTVHDQFSTCSYYIHELQQVAKEAYKIVGDREQAESICEEAFGIHRQLPMVGSWELNEIDNAEFIIC